MARSREGVLLNQGSCDALHVSCDLLIYSSRLVPRAYLVCARSLRASARVLACKLPSIPIALFVSVFRVCVLVFVASCVGLQRAACEKRRGSWDGSMSCQVLYYGTPVVANPSTHFWKVTFQWRTRCWCSAVPVLSGSEIESFA